MNCPRKRLRYESGGSPMQCLVDGCEAEGCVPVRVCHKHTVIQLTDVVNESLVMNDNKFLVFVVLMFMITTDEEEEMGILAECHHTSARFCSEVLCHISSLDWASDFKQSWLVLGDVLKDGLEKGCAALDGQTVAGLKPALEVSDVRLFEAVEGHVDRHPGASWSTAFQAAKLLLGLKVLIDRAVAEGFGIKFTTGCSPSPSPECKRHSV